MNGIGRGVLALVVGLVGALAAPARAVDQPISGRSLTLKKTATGERLTFVSSDPAFHSRRVDPLMIRCRRA